MILGVSKVAQSGFLSGLNNLIVCSMESTDYQPYFGLTEPEVRALLSDKSAEDMKLVKKHYNGYTVPFLTKGSKRIPVSVFNPWSIGNFKRFNLFNSFWVNTSSTLILKDFIQRTMDSPKFSEVILENPIKNEYGLQHDMSYTNIKSAGISEIITFMFNVGFLTQDENFKLLRVPNEEIKGAMISMLKDIISLPDIAIDKPYSYFQEGKIDDFGRFLMEIMFQAFSSFDFPKDVKENAYHTIMLALWYPRTQNKYKISSNPNCGRGRCDLIIHPFDTRKPPVSTNPSVSTNPPIPADPSISTNPPVSADPPNSPLPAVLFEFKKATVDSSNRKPTPSKLRSILDSSAQTALNQISDNLYSYAVPDYCDFMYEIGMSFYQRDFFFRWNKRERVDNKQEHVDKKQKCDGDDLNIWSDPLKSGSFCSIPVVHGKSLVASRVKPVPKTT
jgi:Predicted AAA-ATPase